MISCTVSGPACSSLGFSNTLPYQVRRCQTETACVLVLKLPLTCRLTVAFFTSGGDTRSDGTLQTPHYDQYLRMPGSGRGLAVGHKFNEKTGSE